jgi:hypothetical protein
MGGGYGFQDFITIFTGTKMTEELPSGQDFRNNRNMGGGDDYIVSSPYPGGGRVTDGTVKNDLHNRLNGSRG